MEMFNFMTRNIVAHALIDDKIIKFPFNKNIVTTIKKKLAFN